jgi:hypothetical protein
MRDFRNAKAMAQTLRAALATKGLKITIGQSLELVAKMFGVADWNTLAVAIRREAVIPQDTTIPPRSQNTEQRFSAELKSTLHRALSYANQRKHEYTTLEHLLLALVDDMNASGVMKVCDVDVDALREDLASYIDNDLKALVIDGSRKPRPTPAFQRVIQRAAVYAQGLGREKVTGADVLVAIFDEDDSPAVWLLGEQEMTREDAENFILHGIVWAAGNGAG